MDFNRTFQYTHNGQTIDFSATYDPKTHTVNIVENEEINYILTVNPTTREWSTTEDPSPSIPIDVLVELVQKSFGISI